MNPSHQGEAKLLLLGPGDPNPLPPPKPTHPTIPAPLSFNPSISLLSVTTCGCDAQRKKEQMFSEWSNGGTNTKFSILVKDGGECGLLWREGLKERRAGRQEYFSTLLIRRNIMDKSMSSSRTSF